MVDTYVFIAVVILFFPCFLSKRSRDSDFPVKLREGTSNTVMCPSLRAHRSDHFECANSARHHHILLSVNAMFGIYISMRCGTPLNFISQMPVN